MRRRIRSLGNSWPSFPAEPSASRSRKTGYSRKRWGSRSRWDGRRCRRTNGRTPWNMEARSSRWRRCCACPWRPARKTKTNSAFEGMWGRGGPPGSWDPTKPPAPGQQAPLTPEYQAVCEANLAKAKAGIAFDPKYTCGPVGMPRVLALGAPMEFIVKPTVVYMLLESTSPLRRNRRGAPGLMIPTGAMSAIPSASGSIRIAPGPTTRSKSRPGPLRVCA
jgi:hypothetical protein